MNKLRDPIHGFIEVSDLELKIIDSKPFQRLRNIKQLATTYLVYHGAEHTRFGHSLGVMHLVDKAFNSALSNYEKRYGKHLFDKPKRKWYRQILRLIGLTHDLGHAPFSHASEDLFEKGLEHEDYTHKIICETEIANYICEIGKNFKTEYGETYDITPELLWLIYGEKKPEMHQNYKMPDFKFLKSFMDSELDCDKMDYLLRDSYYCGVNYGNYDINRLISSLSIFHKPEHNIMQLAVEKGGIHTFEEFVIARYFMFIQVYFHRTRRYLDKLLVECLKKVLNGGKYPIDINEYLNYNDDVILDKIKQHAAVEQCAKDYEDREVMSCAYETSAHSSATSDSQLFKTIERELKTKLECDIITDIASKSPHKIPILEQYNYNSGKGIPILDHRDKPISLSDESILLSSLTNPIDIKRIYVDREYADKAREIVNEMFNYGEE